MKRLIYLFIILFHSWLYCYAESGQRISVLDFGAIPDDGLDDSENIRKDILSQKDFSFNR